MSRSPAAGPAHDLIGAIYDAAAGNADWADVAAALRDAVGAGDVSLLRLDPNGAVELLAMTDFPEDAALAYQQHFHRHDPWAAAGQAVVQEAVRTGVLRGAVFGPELIAQDAYRRSVFWNEFASRVGVYHLLGAMQPLGEAGTLLVGLHRPQARTEFAVPERQAIDALLPHLRRALQLRHALQLAPAQGAVAGFDAIAKPAMIVDAELNLLHANQAAEALFRTGDLLARREGSVLRLAAPRTEDTAALRRLAARVALANDPGAAIRVLAPGGATFIATVAPLPAPARTPGPPRALILVRSLAPNPDRSARLLADLYGLTQAEAAVALAAAEGHTAERIATDRATTINTIRTQLRRALEKTAAANLRELTRIITLLER